MEKWNEIFANEELTNKLITQSPEEVQKTLAGLGYEFSLEEIMAVGRDINEYVSKLASSELSEDDLEAVAGGKIGWNFKTGFIVGAVVAAGIILGW